MSRGYDWVHVASTFHHSGERAISVLWESSFSKLLVIWMEVINSRWLERSKATPRKHIFRDSQSRWGTEPNNYDFASLCT